MELEHQLVHAILLIACPELRPPKGDGPMALDYLAHRKEFLAVARNVFDLDLAKDGKI